MNFWKRLRFYLIGFSIGICFVLLFFGPRAVSCSYFPNSRALEEARFHPMTFSDEAAKVIEAEKIDSVFMFNELLKKSKVTNLGSDEVRATPCRTYRAEYREEKAFNLVYDICKNKTIIKELKKVN